MRGECPRTHYIARARANESIVALNEPGARANAEKSAWCAGELVDGRARLRAADAFRDRWRARPQGSPRQCSSASTIFGERTRREAGRPCGGR